MKASVLPQDKERFQAEALRWHQMVSVLGWSGLSEMAARRQLPLHRPLRGNLRRRKKAAKKELLQQMAYDLRKAGLLVS